VVVLMYNFQTHYTTNLEVGGMDPRRGRKKCVKCKMEDPNLVLGEGMKLNEILAMEEAMLVGRFASKRMSMETLKC
jgi:hypothetical protein